jgi:hypothetical protein
MVHRHAPAACRVRKVPVALGAFSVRWVEGAHVGGLKLQLRDVAVQQDETLLANHDAKGKT